MVTSYVPGPGAWPAPLTTVSPPVAEANVPAANNDSLVWKTPSLFQSNQPLT